MFTDGVTASQLSVEELNTRSVPDIGELTNSKIMIDHRSWPDLRQPPTRNLSCQTMSRDMRQLPSGSLHVDYI
jgi:hypothetical protein